MVKRFLQHVRLGKRQALTRDVHGYGQKASSHEEVLIPAPVVVQERGFVVGALCAVRVQLYHVLWHYKHKLRATLKKALRSARAALKACRLLYYAHAPQFCSTGVCQQCCLSPSALPLSGLQKYLVSPYEQSMMHAALACSTTSDVAM